MKILIVDDNPLMRQAIKAIVAKPDDQTAECADGKSVVSAFEAFKPDWVLMDVKMKPVNGIQATRDLMAAFPNAHVAIVTNYGDQEFKDEAKAAGAEKYFLKDNLPAIRNQLFNSSSANSAQSEIDNQRFNSPSANSPQSEIDNPKS